jgi:hypothetical protein
VPQCNYELKNASILQESTQDGTRICSVGNWDNYHHRRCIVVAYGNVQPGRLVNRGVTNGVTQCLNPATSLYIAIHVPIVQNHEKSTYLQLLQPLHSKWVVNLLDAICEGLLLLVDKFGVVKTRDVTIGPLVGVGKVTGPQLGKLEGNVWRSSRLAGGLCAHADRCLIQKLPDLLVRKFLIGVILEKRLMRWQQLHVGVVRVGCTTRLRNLRSNFF